MKQKDIVAVMGTVMVSALFAFVIFSKVFGGASKNQTAEVVDPITSEFNLPSDKVFNNQAVNPTKLIEISPNDNSQPFANQ